MMLKRRALACLATLAVGAAGLGTAAAASAHSHEAPIPPHAHMLLVGADVDFGPDGIPTRIEYRKCIDLANNRTLKLHAHHEHLHFGRAGVAQRAAGHLIVPTAPAFGLPWGSCAEFMQIVPPR